MPPPQESNHPSCHLSYILNALRHDFVEPVARALPMKTERLSGVAEFGAGYITDVLDAFHRRRPQAIREPVIFFVIQAPRGDCRLDQFLPLGHRSSPYR